MSRRLLGLGSLLVLAACQGDRLISPPPAENPVGPVFDISSNNSNLGWRPPIANQSTTGQFNPNLSPTVQICQTSPAAGCTDYPDVGVTGGQYHLNWKTPKTAAQFRIHVLVLGGEVGFVDVNTTKTNVPGAVQVNAGANLPIKFVLTSDCATTASCIDPGTGGTVTTTTGAGQIAGVTIPPQPGGGPPITVNFAACEHPLSEDGLIVFGSCITINSNLGEAELTEEALVFICDVLNADLPGGEEHDLIHMHRRHNGNITVLPNEHAPLCPSVGADASVGGMLRALAHGQFGRAASQLVGLIGPKPLYASVLHLGAGGTTKGFSDFQFALEQTGDALPIGYESNGWSYQIDGELSENWQNGPLFEATGRGGFGEDHNECSLIINNTHTSWPAGITELYLRRNVVAPVDGTITISVAIDNDIQVWVDGVLRSGSNPVVHDGCPTQGSSTFTAPVSAGVHTIAIRAIDRGGSSYFDASVTFAPGEIGGN